MRDRHVAIRQAAFRTCHLKTSLSFCSSLEGGQLRVDAAEYVPVHFGRGLGLTYSTWHAEEHVMSAARPLVSNLLSDRIEVCDRRAMREPSVPDSMPECPKTPAFSNKLVMTEVSIPICGMDSQADDVQAHAPETGEATHELLHLRERIEHLLSRFATEVSIYADVGSHPPGEGVLHIIPEDSDDEVMLATEANMDMDAILVEIRNESGRQHLFWQPRHISLGTMFTAFVDRFGAGDCDDLAYSFYIGPLMRHVSTDLTAADLELTNGVLILCANDNRYDDAVAFS